MATQKSTRAEKAVKENIVSMERIAYEEIN